MTTRKFSTIKMPRLVHYILNIIFRCSRYRCYLSFSPTFGSKPIHPPPTHHSAAYEAKDVDVLSDPIKSKELNDAFAELRKLGELQKDHVESIKHVTEQVRAVKISPPENAVNVERVHNPLYDTALAEAKDLTEKHGIHSSEAKLAWETLEDIASNDMSQVMKGAIDAEEECLVEMMEACEAMEELNRALFLKEKV